MKKVLRKSVLVLTVILAEKGLLPRNVEAFLEIPHYFSIDEHKTTSTYVPFPFPL